MLPRPPALTRVLPLVLATVAGCGGADSDPGGTAAGGGAAPASPSSPGSVGPTSSPAPGARTGAGQRPLTPEQVFTNRQAQLGAWYDDFKRRFRPSQDGWSSEVVATAGEALLERGLRAGLDASGGLEEHLAADFVGTTALRPSELETDFDDGVLRVRRAAEPPTEVLAREDFAGALGELLAPLRSGVRQEVIARVLRIVPSGPRTFDTLCELRLSAERGAGGIQVNTRWRVELELPDAGGELTLRSLALDSFEEAEFRTRPFVELTDHLLLGELAQSLRLGCLERFGRIDRLAGPTRAYLGMHGMAVGDVNGDDLEDLYVSRPGGLPNWLLVRRPDGTLEDEAAAAHVDFLDDTAGVLVVDLDGDGARDLVMGRLQDIVIAWNDGKGRFPKHVVLPGEGPEQIFSISAADADSDGDLDLYGTRYVKGGIAGGVPTPYHDAENGASNLYWRNDGEAGFRLATEEVGLDENNRRFSLASIWEDFDEDGDLDLYVTNDFGRNNLYRNDGGHFTDVADDTGARDMAAGMGVACADVDLDGDMDVYVSNMCTEAGTRITANPAFMSQAGLGVRGSYAGHVRGNTLLKNRGDGTFEDETESLGCGPGGWAWGAVFADCDNDGYADLFVPNGFLTGRLEVDLESFFWRCVVNASPPAAPATTEYQRAWVAVSQMSQVEGLSWNGRERNYGYWNLAGERFADVSAAAGLDHADDARVACVVDWDGDGRQDLWIRNRTAPVMRFLHNRCATPSNWVALELVGSGQNGDAIGALVSVEAGGHTHRRRVYAGEGYLGSSSRRLHFGLGDAGVIDSVRVRWPDGREQELEGIAPGALWRVRADGGTPERIARAGDLDGLAEHRVPEQKGAPVARIPVLDRLPLASLELPSFAEPRPQVSTFAGKPLLVVLWASWSDESRDALARLARELDPDSVGLYPITVDSPRDEAYARGVLAELGLRAPGGRAGRTAKKLLEIAVFEIVGAYSDLPLPVGLLFDGQGALSVVYLGEIEGVAEDAALVQVGLGLPESRWPTALTGGRWVDQGPSRRLGALQDFLAKAGEAALAAELAAEIERRSGN